MGLLELPRTGRGVLIAIGVIAVIVVWQYAMTLLTVAIGTVVIALLLYAIYVLVYRANRLLRDKRVLGGGNR